MSARRLPSPPGDDPAQPLAGHRVIDASTVVMGPYAAQWLADLGADVIRVEAPAGDSTRHTGPAAEPGMAALHLGVNRNKRSVVIDLKLPQGREAMQRLLGSADIFLHNMRPQKLAPLGLDAQSVCARHPRLVYASLNGYGEDGPYGGQPAYDDIIQGQSGVAALLGRQSGTARYMPTIMADKTSGLVAALTILAALVRRNATGHGSRVEVPMFETMVASNLVEHFYGAHFEPPRGEPGYPRMLVESRRPYPTADGLICLLPYTDQHWRSFFAAAGREDLQDDPRFTSIAARTRHIGALYETAGALIARETTAYWLDLCARLEIPATRVNDLPELLHDPHLLATGFFADWHDPAMGHVRFPGVPVRLDGKRPTVRGAARLGADTHAVFAELGLSDSEYAAYLASGALREG